MDGTKRRAAEPASVGPSDFYGILYAEDFDEPYEAEQISSPKPEEPIPPPLTQADVEAACAAAVQQARLEWQSDEERQHAARLATIQETLTEIQATCEQTCLSAAEHTVTTILSILAGLLPEFCRNHGPNEVRALLGRLLPTLRAQVKITIRVHPEVVSAIQRDIDQLEPDLAPMIAVMPATLGRADVKVSWENGSMTRDSQQIVQAIRDALGQLGLHRDVEAPTKRTLAYAD